MTVAVEICVSDVPSVVAAQEGGADRVELCANLGEGGTTPSAGAIALACRLSLPIHVIIRPRGGDFCYLDVEFEAMRHDIGVARSSAPPASSSASCTPTGPSIASGPPRSSRSPAR